MISTEASVALWVHSRQQESLEHVNVAVTGADGQPFERIDVLHLGERQSLEITTANLAQIAPFAADTTAPKLLSSLPLLPVGHAGALGAARQHVHHTGQCDDVGGLLPGQQTRAFLARNVLESDADKLARWALTQRGLGAAVGQRRTVRGLHLADVKCFNTRREEAAVWRVLMHSAKCASQHSGVQQELQRKRMSSAPAFAASSSGDGAQHDPQTRPDDQLWRLRYYDVASGQLRMGLPPIHLLTEDPLAQQPPNARSAEAQPGALELGIFVDVVFECEGDLAAVVGEEKAAAIRQLEVAPGTPAARQARAAEAASLVTLATNAVVKQVRRPLLEQAADDIASGALQLPPGCPKEQAMGGVSVLATGTGMQAPAAQMLHTASIKHAGKGPHTRQMWVLSSAEAVQQLHSRNGLCITLSKTGAPDQLVMRVSPVGAKPDTCSLAYGLSVVVGTDQIGASLGEDGDPRPLLRGVLRAADRGMNRLKGGWCEPPQQLALYNAAGGVSLLSLGQGDQQLSQMTPGEARGFFRTDGARPITAAPLGRTKVVLCTATPMAQLMVLAGLELLSSNRADADKQLIAVAGQPLRARTAAASAVGKSPWLPYARRSGDKPAAPAGMYWLAIALNGGAPRKLSDALQEHNAAFTDKPADGKVLLACRKSCQQMAHAPDPQPLTAEAAAGSSDLDAEMLALMAGTEGQDEDVGLRGTPVRTPPLPGGQPAAGQQQREAWHDAHQAAADEAAAALRAAERKHEAAGMADAAAAAARQAVSAVVARQEAEEREAARAKQEAQRLTAQQAAAQREADRQAAAQRQAAAREAAERVAATQRGPEIPMEQAPRVPGAKAGVSDRADRDNDNDAMPKRGKHEQDDGSGSDQGTPDMLE